MKIIFIISNPGTGRGGHYHSLDHITRELAKVHECKIISLGSGNSPVLSHNPFFFRSVKLNRINFASFIAEIKGILKSESPDIIHFFDVYAYNISRFALDLNNQRICITKCGGPNPKVFPYIPNILLFSVENYDWFKSKNKYSNCQIELIPNRVNKLVIDKNYRPIPKNIEEFNFVRICRIAPTYLKSIEDSINLIEHLVNKGFSQVRLYIIGEISAKDTYNKLKIRIKEHSKYIHLITSSELTQEASKMLYLADVALGTGRGIMEASSLGIPILTFNKEDVFPAIVDSLNFNDIFETNFSQRNIITNFSQINNLNKIERMINDRIYYQELSYFSLKMFESYFDASKINVPYKLFYEKSIQNSKRSITDFLYTLRHIYMFIKRSN